MQHADTASRPATLDAATATTTITTATTLTTAAATALLLALGACAGNATDDGPTGGGGAAMEIDVRTDRSVYDTGDPMELTLTARNTSDAAVTLEFATGQRYDFRIEDATGGTEWRWSDGMMFTQALGSETVGPGEELTWTQTAAVDIEPGEYSVVGTVTTRPDGLSDRTTVTVR